MIIFFSEHCCNTLHYFDVVVVKCCTDGQGKPRSAFKSLGEGEMITPLRLLQVSDHVRIDLKLAEERIFSGLFGFYIRTSLCSEEIQVAQNSMIIFFEYRGIIVM